MFVFAWISFAFSTWLDDIELAPWLPLAVVVGRFAVRSIDYWQVSALWSGLALIAAHVTADFLGVPIHHGLSNPHGTSTHLQLIFLETLTDLALAAGIALGAINVTKVTYDSQGVICSLHIEGIFNYRFFLLFAALPFFIFGIRSLEALAISSFLHAHLDTWTILQSDILGIFMMMPVVLGANLSLIQTPTLKPDIKPLWAYMLGFTMLVIAACAVVATETITLTPAQIILMHGLIGITALILPTLHVVGCLLLLNCLGILYSSQFITIELSEILLATVTFSVGTLVIMLSRMIGQLKQNKSNDRMDAYLKNGVNAYVIKDPDYQNVFVSEQFTTMTGYDVDTFSSATDFYVDFEDSKRLVRRPPVGDEVLGSRIDLGICKIRCKNGSLKTVHRYSRLFEGPDGNELLLIAFDDVTDLTSERDKIDILKRRSEKILEAGVNAFIVEDDKDNVVYASPAAMALFKFSSLSQFVDSEDFYVDLDLTVLSSFRAELARAPEEKIMKWGARKVQCGDGSIVTVEVSYSWFQDVDENWMLMIGFTDVSELERARQQAEDYLKAGLNAYTIQDETYATIYTSDEFKTVLGYKSLSELQSWEHFYADHDEAALYKRRREILATLPIGGMHDAGVVGIRSKSGEIFQMKERFKIFLGPTGQRYMMTAYEDVTDLIEEREFTNSLLSNSSALIVTTGTGGLIHSVSQAFVDLMGYAREDIIGRDFIDFYHPEEQKPGAASRSKFRNIKTQELTIERRLIDANQQTKTFILNVRKSSASSVYDSIVTLSDVTAAKEAEEKLKRLVEVDELTGLFSRRGLNRRFGSDQRNADLGMYLIDLDHFKSVNDGYGHDAGDKLLKATANALKSQTRTEGSCFRLGGEEFAVLRPWRGWKDAHDFAENLRELIGATSIESDGRSVQRTVSIGVSYLPVSGSMSEALNLGDMVLREAKALGRNRSILADESMLETLRSRGMFIQASEVQLALERGELEYFVQPIVNGPERNTVGFEALVRWFLPSGELVEPKKFVDLLYQVIRQPRYAQLKLELRRQVLEQLKDYPESYVSFNFTLEQIGYLGGARALHRDIQTILDHPDRQIVIELSEKALHARVNEEILIEELSQLRAYGYKIALDDFGVEASNIQRLQHYPIDIVKLDRSLIMDIETSDKARKMVGSLAVLLKSLELDVTVEGMETQKQADILNDFGLTIHQGYLYSKPVPPEDLKSLAAE